jgi:processive 1,2-diacylglycerol beta-glucosyltransferase
MTPRILIFVSKTGGGHISLAEALRDQLEPDFSVELVDPQPGMVHLHYRLVSRHALWLWAVEFRSSNNPFSAKFTHKIFTLLLEDELVKVLREYQPDFVISTYPYLTCEVMSALRRLRMRAPFAMLQADPNGVHQSWLSERDASAVFCPTRETHTQTLKAGFPPERVYLTGWPIRAQFYHASQSNDRVAILNKLGLDPERFTIFLQGGGEGAAKFVRTIENVIQIPEVQVILAAGTNKALLRRFQGRERLHALPFTSTIAPFMAAANVIMGKAGPNMLFESVTLGKPFIATSYIPGQEKVNLQFIEHYRLGWVALKARSQATLIRSLVANPTRLQAMEKTVAAYRDWNLDKTNAIPALVREMWKKSQ